MAKRNVTEATKKQVAGAQHYKCANKPKSKLKGLGNYNCPLWEIIGDNKGSFDNSGYEIDHITEHSVSRDDDIENLQALCKLCHSVKTKRFLMDIKDNEIPQFTYSQLSQLAMRFYIFPYSDKNFLIGKILEKITIDDIESLVDEIKDNMYFVRYELGSASQCCHQLCTNNIDVKISPAILIDIGSEYENCIQMCSLKCPECNEHRTAEIYVNAFYNCNTNQLFDI
jgi:hypothetical protein